MLTMHLDVGFELHCPGSVAGLSFGINEIPVLGLEVSECLGILCVLCCTCQHVITDLDLSLFFVSLPLLAKRAVCVPLNVTLWRKGKALSRSGAEVDISNESNSVRQQLHWVLKAGRYDIFLFFSGFRVRAVNLFFFPCCLFSQVSVGDLHLAVVSDCLWSRCMKMCNKYNRPFYLSLNTLDLSHRRRASAETSCDSCGGEGNVKSRCVTGWYRSDSELG